MKSLLFKFLLASLIPTIFYCQFIEMNIYKKPNILNLQNKNYNKNLKNDLSKTRFLEDINKNSSDETGSSEHNLTNKTQKIEISEEILTNKTEKIEITADIPSTLIENEFNHEISDDFNYTSHIWVVKAQIGEPNQEFNLEIDTTISTTWVPSVECKNCESDQKYNASESRTARVTNQTIKIEDYLGDLKGEVVYDDFLINSLGIELRNFPFIQAIELKKKYNDLPEGKIALSNVNKYGEKFSFLNALEKKGKIRKKVFALEFNEDEKEEKDGHGKIYLGDLPDHIKKLKNEDKFGFCNATTSEDLDDKFRDGWTCELTHISFNEKNQVRSLNDSIEIENARVIFDSSYEFIGVSKNQYDLIYQNYIKENFKGMCRKNEKNDEIYFICNLDKNKINNAESLFITVQGYVLELTAEELFVELDTNHNYLFAIKFFDDEDESDTKLWLLGHLFLKNFITVFDAEDNEVSFYSENVYDKVSEWEEWYNSDYYSILLSRYFYLAIGACVVVALFLIFVCFLVFRSIRRKNYGHGPLIENEIK